MKTFEQHRQDVIAIVSQKVATIETRLLSPTYPYKGAKHPDRTGEEEQIVDRLLEWKARLWLN